MFFYYQLEGGQDSWRHDLLSSKQQVLDKQSPRYVSVLSLSRPIESDTPHDEIERIKYAGPFYVDFDSKDLGKAIEKANLFADKLQEHEVDLDSVYLYATGGRGFHMEVPAAVLMSKVPKDGIAFLPYVYKEIAKALIVETMDLAVYSGKRGRMWRTPNVQRENGAYKVPISLAELRSMTVERYAEVCAQPRQYVSRVAYGEVSNSIEFVPLPESPKLALGMARLYAEALLKVSDGLRRRKQGAKASEVLAKFKGEFPPTVAGILSNKNLRADAGWNQIAMQIAITARELGKPHDEVVAASAELIQNHQGNGTRYASPADREQELRLQLAYLHDNPCYTFSVGAIKALLVEGTPAVDLDGVTSEKAVKDIEQALEERRQDDDGDEDEDELNRGVVIGVGGIRQKMKEGWMTWTKAGFDRVSMLTRADTGKPLLFEADLFFMGQPRGRVQIPLETFLSRQKFHGFVTAETGASFQGTDATVQAIQEAMIQKARIFSKENAMELVLRKEGIDVVNLPANMQVPEEAREPFPVWVSVSGCAVPKRIQQAGLSFRYIGDPNPAGLQKADVMHAPKLEGGERLRNLVHSMAYMNRPRSIGPMLGWLAAAHARMFYHRYKGAFPLLGVAGESGAGKTTTMRALGRLHFYKREIPEIQAFRSTSHAIEERILSTCSVPVVLNEYKTRTASPERVEAVRAIFRSAYDNGIITKGGGAQLNLSSAREISERTLSAPIVYMGEALESETAIAERTVQCAFDIPGQTGRDKHKAVVDKDSHLFSSVGCELARLLLTVQFSNFCESFDKDYAIVYDRMFRGNNYRIVLNYAIALHGMTLLQEVLESVKVYCTDDLAMLREAILEGPISLGGDVIESTDGKGAQLVSKSEAAKVLSALATMSLMGDERTGTKLEEGKDYAFSTIAGEEILELVLPFAFAKYEEWCSRKRRPTLYETEEAFRFGMRNFVAYLDSTPTDERLLGLDGVMRFRVSAMRQAQVSNFKKRA